MSAKQLMYGAFVILSKSEPRHKMLVDIGVIQLLLH